MIKGNFGSIPFARSSGAPNTIRLIHISTKISLPKLLHIQITLISLFILLPVSLSLSKVKEQKEKNERKK